ncbi:hypothetical protein Hypma_012780 [Hypsizygus marmoreus]|uniref:Uncharacterized protein n=1 Tax=Hypsizygus marmoreus TaxID=39966 RepID=A0A369JHQ4_HYPMA|nr:hypothetical protein Hypma_012780 [Hypsizygus marmoreus]
MDSDAPKIIQQVVDTMRLRPDLLQLTPFALECMAYASERQAPASPGSPWPTLSDASRLSALTLVSQGSDTTIVSAHAVSDYERDWYYSGITDDGDHPLLLYRTGSDRYPCIPPTGRNANQPTKSLRGVHGTPLNKVWRAVGPQVSGLVKKAVKTRYSIDPARFITHGEDKDTLGPVVVWIAVYPGSTSADTAHEVSKDILELLKRNGVEDVEVEWHEAVTEKAIGPALLCIVGSNHATVDVRRHLTSALGIPIATAEREEEDTQGTIGFFFHENHDRRGMPSTKVYAVTNHHVLRKRDEEKYEFRGAGAPRQYVRVCGLRRFQKGLNEIRLDVSRHSTLADLYTREIIKFEEKETSQDEEEAEEDAEQLRITRQKLDEEKRAVEVLEQFYNNLKAQWSDIGLRNIGHVHYSPRISVDVEGERFTEDWGTIELLEAKFKDQFRGNVVDLGTAIPSDKLTEMMYPRSDGRPGFKYPENRQFRINDFVTREQLANPKFDSEDQSNFIVLKHGCTTDLTIGRYAGLESFLCDEHGVESVELAIYNYDKRSGPFSAKGDSGSLIFDGLGRMVGLLHSGRLKRGGLTSTHVTYATPAWWVIARIMEKYPHADFYRTGW